MVKNHTLSAFPSPSTSFWRLPSPSPASPHWLLQPRRPPRTATEPRPPQHHRAKPSSKETLVSGTPTLVSSPPCLASPISWSSALKTLTLETVCVALKRNPAVAISKQDSSLPIRGCVGGDLWAGVYLNKPVSAKQRSQPSHSSPLIIRSWLYKFMVWYHYQFVISRNFFSAFFLWPNCPNTLLYWKIVTALERPRGLIICQGREVALFPEPWHWCSWSRRGRATLLFFVRASSSCLGEPWRSTVPCAIPSEVVLAM